MPRAVWKGAIAFGLVHIPVTLYPASGATRLDLDLLDKRDFAPVGYQRINKRTGEPVAAADIVKGYEYEDDQYVVVSEEDFRLANVEATQTVDLLSFVEAADIPPLFFDTPYYLEPGKRAEKGYALLRETLRRSGRVGLATVVIRTRQHLAAVIPVEDALVLDTLRFADEIRSLKDLHLPGADLKEIGVSPREIEMAERLVESMAGGWAPEQYRDTYRDDLMARIEAKVRAGKTHVVSDAGEPAAKAEGGAEVVDLMAMLRRSLEVGGRPAGSAARRANGGKRGAAGDEAAADGKSGRDGGGKSERDGGAKSERDGGKPARNAGKSERDGGESERAGAKPERAPAKSGRTAAKSAPDSGKSEPAAGRAEARRRRA
jgi:DNA end-binding protein Ku